MPTPNMDRITQGGTRFANCFTTNALCSPARGTVLTGTFSHVRGIRGNSEQADNIEKSDPDVLTFPELLQAAAYRIGPHQGVRTHYYTLIEYYADSSYWEFFDLTTDPNEVSNRYEDRAYAPQVERLAANADVCSASTMNSKMGGMLVTRNFEPVEQRGLGVECS